MTRPRGPVALHAQFNWGLCLVVPSRGLCSRFPGVGRCLGGILIIIVFAALLLSWRVRRGRVEHSRRLDHGHCGLQCAIDV